MNNAFWPQDVTVAGISLTIVELTMLVRIIETGNLTINY